MSFHKSPYSFRQGTHYIVLLVGMNWIFYHDLSMGQIFRDTCRTDGLFKLILRGQRLNASILSTNETTSLAECARFCIKTINCKSFNLATGLSNNQNTLICELLSEIRDKESQSTPTLESSKNWKYYEPVQGQVCQD